MTAEPLIYECQDKVAVITLNRPEALNALTVELLDALASALDRAGEEARAVLLTGAGRGFCSGADLAAQQQRMMQPDRDLGALLDDHYHPVLRKLRNLPCPVVAAVNGAAAGAGMSVALSADIVLAARSAYFLQAFVNIGLVPDAGSSYLLPRLVGQARATAMMMLGEKVPAETAAQWGMIYKVVDDAALMDEAHNVATRLAGGAPMALDRIRQLAQAAPDSGFEDQIAMEANLQREAGRTHDFLEGVTAFMQKRPAAFKGQ
ncbi:2-(1,2-epoxy-1,2-dihydrophenyl)acetyl-CoA isomerase [Rhodothalassium salexigens DSM 2132]|uniref:2-(1,2-epoxy-1,2-dihydrophenyl)acetyl-CoA isomerase n=1 Tax=Rhodothalassium salexigens DSM 2132 TaxID=1188247 RepID=A0A4R2PRB5_RHOSA|nr:enoyl-CoA hydratase-related protein [Rhodothalassium salexigens]MBB4210238.1 2-(1,2-epoxy-1,2-dihydrophenyl)acetyl-CoA isomerase [Rhodothalassium salexigens DSM 2132]MBK1638678.1 2-(1,2-epoxy-1,2-dihydrophenyl)acetyl-CoA isomerase [Rhodothalassium salexigens DSM 2132]TCP38402.1 2-(1,2-epoxy-1,2-dihydrophenyl)acetyl-CoA isomerase [Rhodothalassium salexigens DSM 2132]